MSTGPTWDSPGEMPEVDGETREEFLAKYPEYEDRLDDLFPESDEIDEDA